MTPGLRIGDREREAAVAALSEHYVAGRLDKDEYDERCAVAWRARTSGDLTPLFLDLPTLQHPRSVPARTPTTTRPGGPRRGPRLPVLPLLLVLVGIGLLTEPWVFFVLVGVLWWAGVFRWLRGTGAPRSRRC